MSDNEAEETFGEEEDNAEEAGGEEGEEEVLGEDEEKLGEEEEVEEEEVYFVYTFVCYQQKQINMTYEYDDNKIRDLWLSNTNAKLKLITR